MSFLLRARSDWLFTSTRLNHLQPTTFISPDLTRWGSSTLTRYPSFWSVPMFKSCKIPQSSSVCSVLNCKQIHPMHTPKNQMPSYNCGFNCGKHSRYQPSFPWLLPSPSLKSKPKLIYFPLILIPLIYLSFPGFSSFNSVYSKLHFNFWPIPFWGLCRSSLPPTWICTLFSSGCRNKYHRLEGI